MSSSRFFAVYSTEDHGKPTWIIPEVVTSISPGYDEETSVIALSLRSNVMHIELMEAAGDVVARLEEYFSDPPTFVGGVGFA